MSGPGRTKTWIVTIRVVLADDDEGFRLAAAAVLLADGRFDVVDQVGDCASAVAAARRHRPDAVLLDVRMPGGGVAAARGIKALGLPITMAVASVRVDASQAGALLASGVRGIFVKGRIGAALPDLMARCHAGEVLLPTRSEADVPLLLDDRPT